MRHVLALVGLVLSLLLVSRAALAKVDIQVDLGSQTMTVRNGAGETYVWPISSARQGYVTPRGVYRPTSMATMHYSRKYHMSPMPHSIFFRGGYAIHGTNEARALGRPASHGCVRLSKANAATLFSMVKAEGAVIAINGAPPHATMVASAKKKGHAAQVARTKARTAPTTALGYAPTPAPAAIPTLKSWSQNPASIHPFLR